MALVVRGLSNKQIAAELGTKEITVKVHRARVTQKMQASSLADLVRMADRESFVPVVGGQAPTSKTRRSETVTFNGSVSCSTEASEPTFP